MTATQLDAPSGRARRRLTMDYPVRVRHRLTLDYPVKLDRLPTTGTGGGVTASVEPAADDADIADLLWALAYVAGEAVEAAWNADHHPRWPKGTLGGKGGQFRERLAARIEDWRGGDRSGDPLEGFTSDQLRRTARRRGVEVPSSATRDEIGEALLRSVLPDDAGAKERDESVRPDGDGALGEAPADGVRPDERPGDVLPEPRGRGRASDTRPGGGAGGGDSGGPAVPGTVGTDDGGPRSPPICT